MCVFSKVCRCLLAFVVLLALWATAEADPVSPPITDFVTGQPVMYPSFLTEYAGMLYFRSRLPDDGSATGLWYCDGTYAYHAADTGLNGIVTEPSYLAEYDDNLYFAGTASSGGPPRLWQYGPASGVSPAPGSDTGTQQNPAEMTAYNGNLYFRAARFGDPPTNIGIELWKFDGADQTPFDMYPGTGSSFPQHFIEYDGQLYFNACGELGEGTELWRYNGSGMPTNAATINPGEGSSPQNLAVYDNRLFFSARDGVHGQELWSYDGTNASLEADIFPGEPYDSSNPNNLCVYNGKLYFSATDGPDQKHGYELWCYDGTTPPKMVAEINPTTEYFPGDDFEMDSSPADLTVFNGLLYFSADDGSHGRELWSFDGTTARLVADINPGENGSEVSDLIVYNNRLYFAADAHFAGVGEPETQVFALAVPEPSTLLLAVVAGLVMLAYTWRKQVNTRNRS